MKRKSTPVPFASIMNEIKFQALIERLRNSCLFYIKGDALVLGALITLYTTFKLEPPYFGFTIETFKLQLLILGTLIALGLFLENLFTTAQSNIDTSKNLKNSKIFCRVHTVYTLLQIGALAFILGTLSAYFEAAMELSSKTLK